MNRIVVVTGAARGIGKCTAEAFLKDGDTVFLADSRESLLKETTEQIKESGKAYYLSGDVRDWEYIKKLAAMTAEHGGCDVLANCAGVFRAGCIHEAEEDDFDFQFDVNVRGIFHTCKALIPQMLEKKKGAVINVSSVSGMGATIICLCTAQQKARLMHFRALWQWITRQKG